VFAYGLSQIEWLFYCYYSANIIFIPLNTVGLVAGNARAHFHVRALRCGHKNNPMCGRASQPVLRKPFGLRRFTTFLTTDEELTHG
jgi:hypothetical protein